MLDIEELRSKDLIFHYTKFETFLCHILKSHALRFSNLSEKNDPFEILPIRYPMKDRSYLLSKEIQFDKIEELYNRERMRIRPSIRFASFCKNPDSLNNEPPRIRDLGCLRMRMWSQYAGNHSGLCLVFSKDLLLASIDEQLGELESPPSVPMEVVYKNFWEHEQFESPVSLSDMNENNVGAFSKMYYLDEKNSPLRVKDLDYQDEAEFRIVYISEALEYVNYGGALLGLVFGVRASDQDVEYLAHIASEENLQFWKLRFDDNGLFDFQQRMIE